MTANARLLINLAIAVAVVAAIEGAIVCNSVLVASGSW